MRWNIPKKLAAVTGISWIAVQTTVPLFWLIERGFAPEPRQFGWQMYTDMAGGDRFQVIFLDNRVQEIDIAQYTHNVRPGLSYKDNFLDYLCQKFPDARQTQRLQIAENKPYIYQCQN
jgi:hypothetical protein